MKILVTGADGFVGSHLCRTLLDQGFAVRMTGLGSASELQALGGEWMPVGDLSGEVDHEALLGGVDAVVHLAGIAHRFESDTVSDWSLYDRVNHLATRALAEAIRIRPGVKRFLFASSVRVHGDPVVFPVRPDSPLDPRTPYDRSKAAAETAVAELLGPTAVRWAILRPVLVYGPGNRGNMAKLEQLLRSGLPVPLGRRPNRRSFLFIGNLVAAMLAYLTAPDPPSGRTWIVADGSPSSTEELLRTMGRSMGVGVRLLHLPEWLLGGAAVLGDGFRKVHLPFPWTSEVKQKLLGDFFVDISALKVELGWTPPFTLEQSIALTYGPTRASGYGG